MRALLLLLTIQVLAGCGSQRRVGEAWVQKRHLRPGWHMEFGLGRSGHGSSDVRSTAEARSTGIQPLTVRTEVYAEEPPPAIAHAPVDLTLMHGALACDRPTPPTIGTHHRTLPDPREDPPGQEDYADDRPRGPFNPIGLIALSLVLTGVVLAFLSNSALLVAGVFGTGIVLAAIGLRRIRSMEQSGKGFALVGLILGLAGMLLTVMMIIRTGL